MRGEKIIGGYQSSSTALDSIDISNWNSREIQRIDLNAKDFSFAVFGDNKNSSEFKRLIKAVNSDDTSFSIDGGDLVRTGKGENYQSLFKQVRELKKPFLTVIGNHELMGKNGKVTYSKIFGSCYYSFKIGDAYFIALDDSNETDLDSQQMEWLKSELHKAGGYKYRFIFMHVPLFDPRKPYPGKGDSLEDVNQAKQLNNLFDANHITMVFASHIHSYYRGVWGKTPFIITGGAGATLWGSDPEHYFYHYIKVHVSDSGVSYEVKKF